MDYYMSSERFNLFNSKRSYASPAWQDQERYSERTAYEGEIPLSFLVYLINEEGEDYRRIDLATFWKLRTAPNGMVQYFCWLKGKPVVMKPGKFARKFFCAPDGKGPISDVDAQKFAAKVKSMAGRYVLKSTDEYLEMRDAYKYGPPSCMSDDGISHPVSGYNFDPHPVLAYCTGDFELKYLVDTQSKCHTDHHTGEFKVVARCLVSALDSKLDASGRRFRARGQIYGDSELMQAYLQKEGYSNLGATFSDHRVKRLELKYESNIYLMPFIDNAKWVYEIHGDDRYFVVSPSEIDNSMHFHSCCETNGTTEEGYGVDDEYQCDSCSEYYDEGDVISIAVYDGKLNAHTETLSVCMHCDENYYVDAEEFDGGWTSARFSVDDQHCIEVDGDVYSENSDLIARCFVDEDYHLLDDMTPYDDGIYVPYGGGEFILQELDEGDVIQIYNDYFVSELEGKYYLTDTMAATDEFERLEELSTTTEEV